MARILFCTLEYFPGVAGGAEHQARLQAEELVRRGHTVRVVCLRSPRLRSGDVRGVGVTRLLRPTSGRFGTIAYLTILFVYLLLRARRYDVVHVHLANLQADVAVLACCIVRRPVFVKIASGGPNGDVGRLRRVRRIAGHWGLRGAAVLQALSNEIAAELQDVGVDSRKIVAIPNGLDPTIFRSVGRTADPAARKRLDLPENSTIVLFAGRFARYKGVAELLAAWRVVVPGALLVLVGEQAKDAPADPIEPTETLLVRPWATDITEYYAAADIFVLPSHAEGMSNALLEAMASGLAVVATRVGAADEMIVHQQTGLLIPPHDVIALREALDRLTQSSHLRLQLGHAARAEVLRRYSIEAVVDLIEGAYRSHCALR